MQLGHKIRIDLDYVMKTTLIYNVMTFDGMVENEIIIIG